MKSVIFQEGAKADMRAAFQALPLRFEPGDGIYVPTLTGKFRGVEPFAVVQFSARYAESTYLTPWSGPGFYAFASDVGLWINAVSISGDLSGQLKIEIDEVEAHAIDLAAPGTGAMIGAELAAGSRMRALVTGRCRDMAASVILHKILDI